MRILIVLSHPEPKSLTHAVAGEIAGAVRAADPAHEVEIADIAAEGFDPRWSGADVAHYQNAGPSPADVLAEQARIDRADALVLVFPIYWWGMPGQLKGWIDRVFNNGWAYDERPDGKIAKLLGRLKVHIVGIGGADEDLYARHGYDGAMRTQIDHGVFDYCGASVVTSDRLLPVEGLFPASAIERAKEIGGEIGQAAPARKADRRAVAPALS